MTKYARNEKNIMSNYRWVICSLLFFITTVNYMDRQVIALIKNSVLDKEFHFTNVEYGYLNAIFQFLYAFGYLFFGWVIDRFGTKVGYSISVIVWGISSIAHMFIRSGIIGFSIVRSGLGFGEGGNFPGAVKSVAEWFPKKDRAFATSIFNSGSNIGPILSPIILTWLIFNFGWKSAFIVLGIIALIWSIIWFFISGEPQKLKRVSKEELDYIKSDKDEAMVDQSNFSISWLKLLKYKATWSIILIRLMTDPIWWFFLIWLPDYFYVTRGLHLQKSWYLLSSIYILISVLNVFGGYSVKFFVDRGFQIPQARKLVMISSAVCFLPLVSVNLLPNWGVILIIGLAGGAHQSWASNVYSLASDMFPKSAVASVVGLAGFGGAMGGVIFPILCGFILDCFKKFGSEVFGYGIIFLWCSIAYIVAFLISRLLVPKFEPVYKIK